MLKRHHKKFLVFSFLILGSYFYFTGNTSPNIEEKYLDLPKVVQEEILKEKRSVTEYEKKTLSLFNSKEHKEIGEKLFTKAFTKGMYSKDKIRLLQIAKAHLVIAKKLGVKNEN